MVQIAKLIGGAGTGKTTELMRVLGEIIDSGVDPMDVGFVSFTRAARAEAAQRVEERFGTSAEALQRKGWFRTLHSICYDSLGGRFGDRLITETKKDREWLENTLQERCEGFGGAGPAEDCQERIGDASKATVALALWSLARNRLCDLESVRREFMAAGEAVPGIDYCRKIAAKYESAKYVDDRLDFVDLAGRFAGYRWVVDGEPEHCPKAGTTPDIPVWIFDEHQDVSRLLDAVASRLVYAPATKWVYFAGDPFQAVYGFAGSDHRCLLEWECEKYRVMGQSFRCPENILGFGERILRQCSDYFDRNIAPRDAGGELNYTHSVHDFMPRVGRDGESWLLLARTNFLAGKLKAALNRDGIPWDNTRGSGGYIGQKAREICASMLALQRGSYIEPQDWEYLLRNIPAGKGETAWLQRGVKTSVLAGDHPTARCYVNAANCTEFGAAPGFVRALERGDWYREIEGADKYVTAERLFGESQAIEPQVRIGTIHSVKGSEADNVVMLDSMTGRCHRSRASQEGRDAERRISYVGATRARKRLWVLSQRRDQWRMELD